MELSPNDGMTRAMRAQSRMSELNLGFGEVTPEFVAARTEDIEIAVEHLPQSDYVYWVLGQVRLLLEDDVEGALRAKAQSLSINPTFAGTLDLEYQIALRTGAFDEALSVIKRVNEGSLADRFKLLRMCQEAQTLLCMGNAAAAADVARELATLKASDRGVHLLRALACREAGDTRGLEQARAACAKLEKMPSSVLSRQPVPEDCRWIPEALHPENDPA